MQKISVLLVWLGFGFVTSSCNNVQLAPEHVSPSKTPAVANTVSSTVSATTTTQSINTTTAPVTSSSPELAQYCETELGKLPGPFDQASFKTVCGKMQKFDDCNSIEGRPIIHFNKIGTDKLHGKNVLAISLIHGDEVPAGSVTRAWMSRLDTIEPRNSWRVIPLVNPDGLKQKTRYNARGVDLNRNFPSKDWDGKAAEYWEKATRKDPRRFPGSNAASEPETRCLVKHIDDFKPDFIISIHTPLGLLDFDGPHVGNPGFKPLPWVGLGNFVGSLGRYMWIDSKVPVLTIELKGNTGIQKLEEFDRLQDISGTVAIQSGKLLDRTKKQ